MQPTPSESSKLSASTKASDRWVDMSVLMRIKDLHLRAAAVVDGFHNGLHRSPLHGFSVEFSEYRPYSAGDDPRTIDWKLFARSDRYYLKKFEDETNRRCYVVVDQSKSMEFGSITYAKLEYARTLAATLAYFLTLQRDAVGLLTFDHEIADLLPARFRTGQLKRILSLLNRPPRGTATDVRAPLNHLAEIVRHRSLIIIVSDYLVDPESLRAPLAFLRARRHDVMLIRVIDPSEAELALDQPTMLRDIETGREIFIDPATAKATYQTRFKQHEQSLIDLAGNLGIGWTSLLTNEPMDLALLQLLNRQQRPHSGSRSRGYSKTTGGRG